MSWTPDSLSLLGWRLDHSGCSLVSSCGLINEETLVYLPRVDGTGVSWQGSNKCPSLSCFRALLLRDISVLVKTGLCQLTFQPCWVHLVTTCLCAGCLHTAGFQVNYVIIPGVFTLGKEA